MWNQPGVQEIFSRWRKIADSYDRDLTLVGEVWLPSAEAAEYIRVGRLNQVFYFDLMLQRWDAMDFGMTIRSALSVFLTSAACPPGR